VRQKDCGGVVCPRGEVGATHPARAIVVICLAAVAGFEISAAGAQSLAEDEVQAVGPFALAPIFAPADNGVSPFFFGEIVVVDEEDEPPPGTVDVLDAEAIRAAGAVSVGEALDLLPGVSMSIGGRDEQKIWVRGYEQADVLILVDGVPISDPYYGDLDLGQLPVFDVARVTVARGAASPLYGPNGLGGVINITTFQGGDENRLAGELRLTERRTMLANASASGGNERVNWFLGLGAETSDGWPLARGFDETPFEDGGIRVNSDFSRSSAMARVGWKTGDAGTLYASAHLIDADKGIPFHTTEPVGFIKFARFPEWRQTTLALGYEHDWAGGQLRGQLYGHGFENTLDVYADPGLEMVQLESSFSDRVYGGYALATWALGRSHRLGTAVHLRQDRHRKIERYPDGSRDPSESYNAWTWSMSAEDRWQAARRTSLIGSLSLEGYDVQHAVSLREVDGRAELVDDPLPNEILLSPQIELRQVLGRRWSASAAVYHRAQFPTMRQLFGTDPPNPELGPQRNIGVDLGVDWEPASGFTLRGTVFFNRVTDLITRESRDLPFRNQDEAEIRGVELRMEGSTEVVEVRASWTGLDDRFVRSSEGLEEIPFVPNHQLDVIGVVHLGRRIDLRGVWLATGRRVAYDRGARIELDGYSLFNLGVAGRLGVVELSLQIDNALDADVEMEPGYPLPGRRVWLGCRFAIRL
jgi:iron complex outermembrane receptor protein